MTIVPVSGNILVSVKIKHSSGNTSFKNTKSGAGEQFLLPGCRAKACTKGVL